MRFPYYGSDHEPSREPVQLPGPWRTRLGEARTYRPEAGLVDAVNVALLLGQPLLVTGEPGVGKTQLAWHVSWQILGADATGAYREPLIFEAKSVSSARDLFYTFDTLGRFHQAREGSSRNIDYITYNALGKAVLLANDIVHIREWLPDSDSFVHDGPRRSVVLIDEVDKAPRDFPNDILNEIENMYFRVPELGNEPISAPKEMKPVLIITSNSEKSLPDAFLRRCVYYNISPPTRDRFLEIVQSHLEDLRGVPGPYLEEALDFFMRLRDEKAGLRKKPATAELLGWLIYLSDRVADKSRPLRRNGEVLRASLGALIKSADDQEIARTIMEEWLAPSGK